MSATETVLAAAMIGPWLLAAAGWACVTACHEVARWVRA
jgi:hypothetical protein